MPVPTLDPRTLPTIRHVALAVMSLPGLHDGESYQNWASLRAVLLQMVRVRFKNVFLRFFTSRKDDNVIFNIMLYLRVF
jgi:hypothetical protein